VAQIFSAFAGAKMVGIARPADKLAVFGYPYSLRKTFICGCRRHVYKNCAMGFYRIS
jgi:hypothetical protein